MTFHSDLYAQALAGEECWWRRTDGSRVPIPVRQWFHGADSRVDHALVCCCDGPTVDLGCGPGRLVAALTHRGVAALGIDISPMAVAVTRFRGAPALQRDVFDRLPAVGRWEYAILADGNIGIAGDPVRLLGQTRRLLARGGVAIVEFDYPGTGFVEEQIRLETRAGAGDWFPWARVGIDHADRMATAAGLRVLTSAEVSGHYIAWLARS
ncbi:class I SAM-dependent methyltransferase [Nocardia sp. NBC_01730]|uniref:class I SAM-dependent methyltransferase n=1 Tax=Nocardia sp. NBC_01730 TaxID=2975998 RepID=UPI002E0DDE60|nr:class I SAM-dependent methyltransferase [Nocardia sp. NBC_01730]